MSKQLSESDLIRLQIQAYEFYAGLIDRAVTDGAHDAKMPRWDEQRAVEYRLLAEQLRKRLARDRLPGGRARVRVDFEDAAVILRPFDDTFGDPALKRALRVAHRDHLRDEAATVGDVDGVTALHEVDVDAGVLPELADADPLSGQVRCRVVHGITRVPEVRIERLAASPVALLCHAADCST